MAGQQIAVTDAETVPQPPAPTKGPGVPPAPAAKRRIDAPFIMLLSLIGGIYVLMILAMLLAMMGPELVAGLPNVFASLAKPQIQYALKLSLLSCTLSTIFSLWVAVPLGYLMSRYKFPLKGLLDFVLDIPIVLPPLVVGLGLLMLLATPAGKLIERVVPITFAVPSVIIAQFMVAAAFAVRTMRVTFDQIDPRAEQVALTLGCTRAQAFWRVTFPECHRGLLTAGTLAWARSLGEFGPVLFFSGATRYRTEVLPTSVFLEMSVGNLGAALGVSLIMIFAAGLVLAVARIFGLRDSGMI